MKKYFFSLLSLFTLLSATTVKAHLDGSQYIINDLQINYFLQKHLNINIDQHWNDLFENPDATEKLTDMEILNNKFQNLQVLIEEKFKEYTHDVRPSYLTADKTLWQLIDSSLQLPHKLTLCPGNYPKNDKIFLNILKNADFIHGSEKTCISHEFQKSFLGNFLNVIKEHYSWESYLRKIQIIEDDVQDKLLINDTCIPRPLLFIDVRVKKTEEDKGHNIYKLSLKSCHVNHEEFISMREVIKQEPSLLIQLLSGATKLGFAIGTVYAIWYGTPLGQALTPPAAYTYMFV